jgi:hypothetical protein
MYASAYSPAPLTPLLQERKEVERKMGRIERKSWFEGVLMCIGAAVKAPFVAPLPGFLADSKDWAWRKPLQVRC